MLDNNINNNYINNNLFIPKIIAHRGGVINYPENSRAAFKAVYKLGAKMIEFDIQFSQDYVPMILHDERLERMTSQSGNIFNFTAQQLGEVSLNAKSKKKLTEHIPLFQTVLDDLVSLDMSLNIELKSSLFLQDQLNKYRCLDNLLTIMAQFPKLYIANKIFISSFDSDLIKTLQDLNQNKQNLPLNFGLVFRTIPTDLAKLERLINLIHPVAVAIAKQNIINNNINNNLIINFIEKLKIKNIKLLVYTVNTTAEAELLFSQQVDAIFTDRFKKLISILD